MLSETEIQRALHASRVVPLELANPNGPLGLEQLAGAVALVRGDGLPTRVQRPIALSVETWAKLNDLAHSQSARQIQAVSVSDIAAALLEHVVGAER